MDLPNGLPGSLLLLGSEGPPGEGPLRELAGAAGGEVVVLPTAAAYERPERALEAVRRRLEGAAEVRPCMVLRRGDAEDPGRAAEVAAARAIFLCGSSPLHLRSVLKDSLVLHALLAAWGDGALLAAAGPAATAVSDPMVDPRGGAFTVGLGLVRDLALVAGAARDTAQLRRTLALAPASCAIVDLGEGSLLLRRPEGTWERAGEGTVDVYAGGDPAGLVALAGKSLHPAVQPA